MLIDQSLYYQALNADTLFEQAIKKQFGPKATRFNTYKSDWNYLTKQAYATMRAATEKWMEELRMEQQNER